MQIFEVEIGLHLKTVYKKLLSKRKAPPVLDATDIVRIRVSIVVRVAIA